MSMIDRLFDARRRVAGLPAEAARAPGLAAKQVVVVAPRSAVGPSAPAAPAASDAVSNQRGDPVPAADEGVEVIGAFVDAATLGDEPAVPAPAPTTTVPLPAGVRAEATAPIAAAVAAPADRQARLPEWSSHLAAMALVACAVFFIASRLEVVHRFVLRGDVALPSATDAPPPGPGTREGRATDAPVRTRGAGERSVAMSDPAAPPGGEAPTAAAASAAASAADSHAAPAATVDRRAAAAGKAPLVVATATDAAAAESVPGTISFAISPWGEVTVDGVVRGVTPPLDRLSFAPGTYRVEIRNPAAPRYVTTVEVRPGESVTVQHHF